MSPIPDQVSDDAITDCFLECCLCCLCSKRAADLCAGKLEQLAELVALPVHSALPCAGRKAVHTAGATGVGGRTV